MALLSHRAVIDQQGCLSLTAHPGHQALLEAHPAFLHRLSALRCFSRTSRREALLEKLFEASKASLGPAAPFFSAATLDPLPLASSIRPLLPPHTAKFQGPRVSPFLVSSKGQGSTSGSIFSPTNFLSFTLLPHTGLDSLRHSLSTDSLDDTSSLPYSPNSSATMIAARLALGALAAASLASATLPQLGGVNRTSSLTPLLETRL